MTGTGTRSRYRFSVARHTSPRCGRLGARSPRPPTRAGAGTPFAYVATYLDDGGTTVSVLAARAQMTKQAMAELVRHLEAHGYVARVPDPADRRAKLVTPAERGHDVFGVAQDLVPRIEDLISETIGSDRAESMRHDLDALRRAARAGLPD